MKIDVCIIKFIWRKDHSKSIIDKEKKTQLLRKNLVSIH